jgi:hypothetical protein
MAANPEYDLRYGRNTHDEVRAMTQVLRVELPDDLFERVKQAADDAGTTPEQWLVERVRADALSESERREARQRLLEYAGSWSSGDPKASDARRIDEDLAAEYLDTHEDESR